MSDEFSFHILPYAGNEELILTVRNRNRRVQQTREYMDWRLREPGTPVAPFVFALKSAQGDVVGMVAVVHRQYRVNGESIFFPVIGDICLDSAYRGRGLATKLFNWIAEHCRKNKWPGVFVMPNLNAAPRLSAAGWTTIGTIAPYACVLNAEPKLKKVVRIGAIARAINGLYQSLLRSVLRRGTYGKIEIKEATDFDTDFDSFWTEFAKRKGVFRERGAAQLRWRYREQPNAPYVIKKFFHENVFVGYAVCDFFSERGDCLLCEFITIQEEFYSTSLATLIAEILRDSSVLTVRTIVIENSRAARLTQDCGFFKRQPIFPFQMFAGPAATNDAERWYITAGDKDA